MFLKALMKSKNMGIKGYFSGALSGFGAKKNVSKPKIFKNYNPLKIPPLASKNISKPKIFKNLPFP